MRRPRHRRTRRVGFTLIELVVVVAITGILALAMNSSLYIALRASDPSLSPAPAAAEASLVLAELAAELEVATALTEEDVEAITVVVPDRDGGAVPETIRIAWSGEQGDPLTRRYNSGAEAVIAEDVYAFEIDYHAENGDATAVTIHLQLSDDPRAAVHTAVPLPNRP